MPVIGAIEMVATIAPVHGSFFVIMPPLLIGR
jgi:hypothetical protein